MRRRHHDLLDHAVDGGVGDPDQPVVRLLPPAREARAALAGDDEGGQRRAGCRAGDGGGQSAQRRRCRARCQPMQQLGRRGAAVGGCDHDQPAELGQPLRRQPGQVVEAEAGDQIAHRERDQIESGPRLHGRQRLGQDPTMHLRHGPDAGVVQSHELEPGKFRRHDGEARARTGQPVQRDDEGSPAAWPGSASRSKAARMRRPIPRRAGGRGDRAADAGRVPRRGPGRGSRGADSSPSRPAARPAKAGEGRAGGRRRAGCAGPRSSPRRLRAVGGLPLPFAIRPRQHPPRHRWNSPDRKEQEWTARFRGERSWQRRRWRSPGA